MGNNYYAWESVILDVEGKEYKIRHNYVELLKLLGLQWLFEIRTNRPFWRIKGIGNLEVRQLEFLGEIKTLKIKCRLI